MNVKNKVKRKYDLCVLCNPTKQNNRKNKKPRKKEKKKEKYHQKQIKNKN